ncbi:15-methylpalmitoyl-4-hydroxy-2-pyrone 4-O-methyltransferase [Alteribacillus persepolensis]|uniref:15-methylpalmitoyl-4-hydroxy-2-pyrone 4-O-methyltransferase n=1 Tax=Alteribacillus persepolensis TaxID=568899 RepID=A0A1G8F6W6_9BACI|nr:isoprenylcysteine carboxylmethyltransferase family protein [Alteribacillus persepolensis]SDH77923.1 15-methylpalmitoyl-4-hydroxy-2-pyrone 4-O-methyltransferase [Alteribacillus persepolensis]
MTLFLLLVSVVIVQRIAEVIYARRNEKMMKANGAFEAGAEHYKWIVLLHVCFFISLFMENVWREMELIAIWPVFLLLFVIVQMLRVWTLRSLGVYWNTKIIVLPGAEKVRSGPYRYIPHPNYVIVALEIIILPLLFEAFITAILFTVLNALLLLFVRIPAENKALDMLQKMTND